MSNFYFAPTTPYLNDSIFINYGFFTGTSTYAQRQVAYRIAEAQVEQEIGTFLIQRTVTGSFANVSPNTVLVLPIAQIFRVDSVVLVERWSNGTENLVSGTAYITDYANGYIMIDKSSGDTSACEGCSGYAYGVYRADIAFTAGYATGLIVGNPTIELALCMATNVILRQMDDVGIGADSWEMVSTLQVGRTIKTVNNKFSLETSFGVSHQAQYIRQLLKPFKTNRALKLGR